MWSKRFGFFLIGLLIMSFQGGLLWAQDLPSLFTVAPTDKEAAARRAPGLLPDKINVNIDFSLIHPSPVPRAALRAPLPDRDVTVLHNRSEKRDTDNYTWVGEVDDYELSTAVITVVNGVAVGHIDFDGKSYALSLKDNSYQIVKEDPAMAVPFNDDVVAPQHQQADRRQNIVSPAYAGSDDGSTIDVLVLYTQKMSDTYGSGLAAKIQNFVDLANTAYTNSGINTQIRLAHSELYTDAAEGISISGALKYITGSSDGSQVNTPPSAIQTLRDKYGADMVSLLRVFDAYDQNTCGLAYTMTTVDNSFADWAFSVVGVKDASGSGGSYCDSRSFAHELGHNMGCVHDRAHASGAGAYSYSYGYGISGVFGDVMSYIKPRITYFSTPLVKYSGYPVGVDEKYTSDSADCAKTINNTRTTVANFRAETAIGQAGGNNCTATISSSLVVHIPIVTYSNANYWADLQYNAATSNLTVANAGVINDVSFYSNCTASTLSSDLKLHIPVVLINGLSYWADFQYSNSVFVITGYGQN